MLNRSESEVIRGMLIIYIFGQFKPKSDLRLNNFWFINFGIFFAILILGYVFIILHISLRSKVKEIPDLKSLVNQSSINLS